MRERVVLRYAVALIGPLVLASCGSDSCIAPGGGCAAGCVANAANQCVPAAQSGSTGGSGTSTGGGGGAATSGDGGVSGAPKFGTKPSGSHISLDCTPSQIPAFVSHDCLYSHFQDPQTAKCTMKLADRTGLVVGVATPVSFMSEAGDASPLATSPSYPADSDKLGHADGYLEVFGAPLPADVPPMPGELSAQVDFGCGLRTANPRDGYVTVIAWTKGEEGFVDVNQNGKYDDGEPFIDLGEPFVDANDNGKWDPGEWWLDVNGDGQYTGPNGKWDADTTIWTQTRVVYTGLPAFATDASRNNTLTRIYDPATNPPGPTAAATPFSVHAGPPATTQTYGVFFTDALLNPLDPATSYSVAPAAGNVTTALTTPALPLRPPPATFRLLYCDKPVFPASCHDGPADTGCRTSPCYVVPEVGYCLTANCSGFAYGEYATLAITGAKVGTDTVWVSATVAGSTVSFPLSGQSLP